MKSSRRHAGLPFILITMFIDVMGIGLIIPVLPELVKGLSKGTRYDEATVFGLLIGVYALMQFLAAPFIGALSDRLGRRPVLLVSQAGLSVDFLLSYFAPTLGWLFVARILSGITAANITAANAYIADVSAPDERTRNFGMAGGVMGMAFVIGPALGGLIGEDYPRLPFLVAAGLAALNFVYGYFVLPESLPKEARVRPVKGPFGMRPKALNPFASLLDLRQFPSVLGLAMASLCFALALQCLQSTWLLYTAERYNWGARANGLSLAFAGALMALAQGTLASRMAVRFGESQTLVFGMLISAAGFVCYGLSSRPWMLLASMPLEIIGAVAFPVAQSLVTKQVGESDQGAVQGGLTSLQSLAAVVMPPAATFLFARLSDDVGVYVPGVVFFVGAAFLGIGALVGWKATERFREA